MDEVIRPDELHKTTQAKELERAQQIFDDDKRRADERRQVASLSRTVISRREFAATVVVEDAVAAPRPLRIGVYGGG